MVYKLVCHGHHVVGTHHGATFTRLVALCFGQHLEWNETRLSNKADVLELMGRNVVLVSV